MKFNLSDNSALQGFKLILLYPNKVPPHIFVVSEGKFFDLKYNKSSIGDFQEIEQGLIAKGIPILYIHTDYKIDTLGFEDHFKNYKSLTKNLTCLSPIKDYLDWNEVRTVFDFIRRLELNKNNIDYTVYNIETGNKSYEIKEYTEKEIKSYIQRLKN